MLVKLGIIYIKNKQWYDSKVIFKQILRDNIEHSFGWRYLGFSLTKLGEYAEAEKALRRANLLDVENPVIWAYLAIYALSTGKKNQALECLNELNKVNFNDTDLLKEIGNLFLQINEYEIASNIYLNIKNQDRTDGESYLIIAKIYCNKLNKRKEALEILKEGADRVFDGKQKQEIEYLISKIEKEEEDLFTGVITTDDLYNGSDIEINKKKEEEENINVPSENASSVVEQSLHSKEEVISEKNNEENKNEEEKIEEEK
jgi:tetratricopeptide (TPR) repeat protein